MQDLKVAITGGIGSGKSEVLKIINSLGYNIVSLDDVYAQLLREKNFVLHICNTFEIQPIIDGDNYYLDKKSLSSKVFNDKALLQKLNQITHSAIFERAFSMHSGVTFYEVPLLFEGNYQNLFDKVIVVVRNKAERIKSAVARDLATESEILAKINSQVDYDSLDLTEYIVIENNSNKENLREQVIASLKGII